jgi:hypothetical protein
MISYPVSESILMTVEYTSEGQVCMMRLHPRHVAADVNYISPKLPFQELKTVLNQLVPVHTRGAKKEPFDTGATGGGTEWMSYAYENVRFSFVSPFCPAPDSWKTRKEYVFTIEPSEASARPKPRDFGSFG